MYVACNLLLLFIQGDTALHYAYRSESMDVVNILEQHNPEIKSIVNDVRDCYKYTVYMYMYLGTQG